MMNLSNRPLPLHVLRAGDFTVPMNDRLFTRAREYEERFWKDRKGLAQTHEGMILFNIFYEESSRTIASFAAAAMHLGMKVHSTQNAGQTSSAAKGESLPDTIRIMDGYLPDILVLRHPADDGAAVAAKFSAVPVINGGSGRGEHPTQAHTDVYTIEKRMGRIDGLTIIIGGDLMNGRTARSLALMLSMYRPAKIIFVSPLEVPMGSDVTARLTERGISFTETDDLRSALPEADVVYWTRVQKERMPPELYGKIKDRFIIGQQQLALMPEHAMLMHPLPRVGEIVPEEVDHDPRAGFFEQAHNGMWVRAALISSILDRTLYAP